MWYYGYDGNGNVTYEREGGLREAGTAALRQEGNRYWTECEFGLPRGGGGEGEKPVGRIAAD
ncbi:MAG: hypothetical protein LBP23_03625 [Treponema sp.]|jgi:hypothetical protein|nr:hypothetical protein [Treponema sp.]